jgi:outer membrane protein assembly factor BamB
VEAPSASEVEGLPQGYYLVGFAGPIDPGWRRAVEGLGIEIVASAPPYGLVVSGRGNDLARLMDLRTSFGYEAVRGLRSIPLEARVEGPLLRLARREIGPGDISGLRRAADGRAVVRILTFPTPNPGATFDRLRRMAEPDRADANLFVVSGPEILDILRAIPEVAYVEAERERELHDNLAAKNYILNVEPVWTEPSLGYVGTGIIVDHNDSGIDLSHPDLPPGAIVATAGAMSGNNGHGTHTAGSVLGRGFAAPSPVNTFSCGDGTPPLPAVRGMAFGARLVSNNIFDGGFTTETSMFRFGFQQGARISTNSWGYVNLYTYSSHASTVDGLVRDADSTSAGNQELMILFSAGNDGPGSGTVGSPGTAKNVLTVGASENDRCGAYVGSGPDIDTVANFSGRGPAQGRIKPDLVAPGTDVLALESSDPLATEPWDQSWTGPWYATDSGTSMSTPLAAGAAAVFFEFYQNRFGNLPSPALPKAALINGAVDMGFGYPSFQQGWGRLNLRGSIEGPPGGRIRFFDAPEVTPLATGAAWTRDFEVLSIGVPLKLTLVWTDPPAPGGSTSPLVNDLNLVVTAPGGPTYRGNQFTGAWSTPDPGAVSDTANNVENVFVRTPTVGRWTLRVDSALTAQNPPGVAGQDFALVYSGDVIDCLPPAPPAGLLASSPGANRIDVSWNPVAGASTYGVFRATTSGGPFTPIASVSGTSYVDLSVSAGTTYYYTVTAINATGCESAPSGEASALATGDCIVPPTFSGLGSVVSSGTSCAVDLSWSSAATGCPGTPITYSVYRSAVSGFTPGPTNLLDACVTGTSYQDANVASATIYYYVVRAEDGTASGGGACNGGNVDGNAVEKSGGAGLTPTALYSNGFEGLDDFSHGVEVSGNADSWRGIQTNCPAASGSGTYRFGGASCSANYAIDNFASAGPSAAISVPPEAANVRMSFAHRFQLERDGAGVYDGGYVAASVDGSPFQPVAPSRLSGAGYNAVIDGLCSNAVGAPVFSDTSAGYAGGSYLMTSVHLDGVCDDVTGGAGGCAGHDVGFRFVAVSDCAVNLDGWFLDDVSIDADLAGSCSPTPDPLPFFTVTSTDARNTLQWLNPASGGNVTVVFRTDRFPNAADDGTVLTPPLGTPGGPQSFPHEPLPNGTTHYYAAFVGSAPNFSAPRFTSGRPQSLTGNTKWVYQTSAASVSPPGIGSVYAVSNDAILHSMVAGPSGGTWPPNWVPLGLNAPSQARMPVVLTPLAGANKVVFVGTQEGVVHAVDAERGEVIWTSPLLGERVQAAPAGMFTAFGGAYDLVFAATRNSTAPNEVVGLRLADGLPAWRFDNGGGATSIGIVSGSVSVDYQAKRLYFASRSPSGGSPNTLWCISFTDLGASLVWAKNLGDIDGSPVLHRGKLYVGTNASKVYAVDPATGSDLWAAPFDAADGPVKGFVWPGFGTNHLYLATTNTVLALTDMGSSVAEKWRVTAIPSPSTPLYAPGTQFVIVGGGDGRLYQLDVSTTPPTTTFEVLGAGAAAVGAPSLDVAHRIIYVGTTLGAIYAIAFPLL